MDIAALIAWATTALGGLYLLITWLARGGIRQARTGATRFPASLIIGHFLLAASGLITWTAYVLTDIRIFSWAALGALVCVALLGFTMFVRWGGEDQYDSYTAAVVNAPGSTETATQAEAENAAGSAAARRGSVAAGGAAASATDKRAAAIGAVQARERPAESHFPIGIVAAHGGFAVSTLILVLLAVLGVGG
jgi:hypothetical protein